MNLLIKKIRIKYDLKSMKKRQKNNETILRESKVEKRNEKIVLEYITVEKNKPSSNSAISSEYTQKVILYGYLMVINKFSLIFCKN